MIVIATAGTTVGGAYDPINKLADITEKHNIWLHVDVSFTCHSYCKASVKYPGAY